MFGFLDVRRRVDQAKLSQSMFYTAVVSLAFIELVQAASDNSCDSSESLYEGLDVAYTITGDWHYSVKCGLTCLKTLMKFVNPEVDMPANVGQQLCNAFAAQGENLMASIGPGSFSHLSHGPCEK